MYSIQINRNMPTTAPLHSWEWPCSPWSRSMCPFLQKMFLFIVDNHSKWLEAHVTTNGTTATTIDKLLTTFTALGQLATRSLSLRKWLSFAVIIQTVSGIQHVTPPQIYGTCNHHIISSEYYYVIMNAKLGTGSSKVFDLLQQSVN